MLRKLTLESSSPALTKNYGSDCYYICKSICKVICSNTVGHLTFQEQFAEEAIEGM